MPLRLKIKFLHIRGHVSTLSFSTNQINSEPVPHCFNYYGFITSLHVWKVIFLFCSFKKLYWLYLDSSIATLASVCQLPLKNFFWYFVELNLQGYILGDVTSL